MTVTLLQSHPRFTRSELSKPSEAAQDSDIGSAPPDAALNWFMDQVVAPLSKQDNLTGRISAMVFRVQLVDTMVSKSGLGISVDEGAQKSGASKDMVITLNNQFMANVQSEISHGRQQNALALVSNAMSKAMWENFVRGLRQDPSATPQQIEAMEAIEPSQMSTLLSSIMPVAQEIKNIVSAGTMKQPCVQTHLVGFPAEKPPAPFSSPIRTLSSQPHNQALNKALTRAPGALHVVGSPPSLH